MGELDAVNVPPLSRAAMFRDAKTRLNADELNRVLLSAEARFVLRSGHRMLGSERPVSDAHGGVITQLTGADVAAILGSAPSLQDAYFLGRTLVDSTPVFAVAHTEALAVDDVQRVTGQNHRWLVLRDDVDALSQQDIGIFTTVLALANWHREAAFSPATGVRTHPAQGGWMRIDSESGLEIYPRTDPAVIVLITDGDDRVLLGSNVLWEADRFSLLAGFVEAGESLEAAVHREMEEEAGVRVTHLRYVASQPWPFPRSLMIGFIAELADDQRSDDVTPDETEIAALRWFTRDELLAKPALVTLPGKASIARHILDGWLYRREGFVS